jgi:hypothetical protein
VGSVLISLSMWMMGMCLAKRISTSTWPALRVREQLQRVCVRPAPAVGHGWPLLEFFLALVDSAPRIVGAVRVVSPRRVLALLA